MYDTIAQYIHLLLPILQKIILIVIPLILVVAYLTWAERRVIGFMQLRKGPNVVGPFGLLQPIADALKLLHKESIIPANANPDLFIAAPIITFTLSLMAWAVIPVSAQIVIADLNVGVLYLLAISSLSVYGIIIAGWSSNSKYAFLGAMRSAAQMISYELSMGLIIVCVLLLSESMNVQDIVLAQTNLWYAIPLFPLFVMFFICTLAETNRAPFDLPEAEAELVAGYHVEYSAMPFAMFFLAEYANMVLMSSITTILFLGGWLPPLNCKPFTCLPGVMWFALKVSLLLFCFLWVRASLPRYRYDQLMRIGWKVFLPIGLGSVILISTFIMLTTL